MRKTICLFSSLLCALSIAWNSGAVNANTDDQPQPYEQIYSEIGYQTIPEAVCEAEQHFKQKLRLPLRVPAIPFTHYFGRFSDLEGEMNDSLDVEFVNDQSPENHYKIDVRSLKSKIPIKDKEVLGIYKLEHNNKAKYINVAGFHVVVFERDHWQYMLSVDKRTAVTPEALVEIANTIDYAAKNEGGNKK